MELNRYPENYFAEVEQAAFSPANIVPGIGFSPGQDARRRGCSPTATRSATGSASTSTTSRSTRRNARSTAITATGKMRTDGNLGGTLTFNPNSDGLWDNQPDFAEPPMPVDGDGAHWDHRVDDDHWEQPGNLFRLMTPAQQQSAVRQHRPRNGRRAPAHQAAPCRELHAGGPGIRRGRGAGAGDHVSATTDRCRVTQPALAGGETRPLCRPPGGPFGNARRPFPPMHRSPARR